MTEPIVRPLRLGAHPLDSPVVALAFRPAETGGGPASAAAVKFDGDRELDRLALADASRVAELAAFIGDAPVVGHALGDALGSGGAASVWDTQELAGLLLPDAADDTLALLAARLGALPAEGEGALADALTTRDVHLALTARARELPASVLRRLAGLLVAARSPLVDLVIALADAAEGEAGPVGGLSAREVADRLGRPRSIGAAAPAPRLVSQDEVERLLGEDGPIARRFPGYEPRPEQVAMARAVASAFGGASNDGEGEHLVVEGGTGIGKSVAYLLPAVLFAARNNQRVVVSTNTINLQEQLINKDIPDLLAALEGAPDLDLSDFRYAQLKGRANYLCMLRWQTLANSGAYTPDEARLLAKTLLWLRETPTGDRAELRLTPGEGAAWGRVDATRYRECSPPGGSACLYRHAREEAGAAHLLVVNHALLLSDMVAEGAVLPPYDVLIVDEAHTLEDVATNHFASRVTQSTVDDLVDEMGAVARGFVRAARASALAEPRVEDAQRRVDEAQEPLLRVRDSWGRLMDAIAAFTKTGARRREQADEDALRIQDAQRAQPGWSDVEIAWDAFEGCAQDADDKAAALQREMGELDADLVPGLEELRADLGEWFGNQRETRARVRAFVSEPDSGSVYWIGRGASPSLNAAPLDVSALLQDGLFARKRSVVLTSATMAIDGSFDHVCARLGVEDAAKTLLGSPFDYAKAALLCLPTNIPEPRDPGYDDAVAEATRRLALLAEGRTMALFTSHASLRAAASRLRTSLAGTGIDVLAQGVDGAPRPLLARFQAQPRAVLLGTASFWEGVDVGNDALKALVVARLPFTPPNDPLFEARSEAYENPFTEYAVPQAVLRFRQGFGRLIRSRGDRGVAVVLDRRVARARYGRTFLDSIPPATQRMGPFQELEPLIAQWLAERP